MSVLEGEEAYERAKRLDEKIRKAYSGRNLAATTWGAHVSPDMSCEDEDEEGGELSMGRPLTASIAEFIVAKKKKRKFNRRLEARMKYITGTPGCGKTVSLSDAVSYLHATTANALEQREKGTELNEVVRRRLMLLSGDHFVTSRCLTLYRGLIMAYVNDSEALEELKHICWNNQSELYSFLSRRKTKEVVYIIIDDANALDQQRDLSTTQNELRAAADVFLRELVQVAKIVICASIRSNLRHTLEKRFDAEYKLVCGGFSKSELHAFLTFYKDDGKKPDYRRTGTVPRLLRAFMEDEAEFKLCIKWHEEALLRYIKKAGEARLSRLLRAAAGGSTDEFSDVLDSRCFYRGSGGNGECLTMHLRTRAMGWATQKFSYLHRDSTARQIKRLMDIAAGQQTTAAVGITAESAALLVIRLREPVILQSKICPEAIRFFRGKLTKLKMNKLRAASKKVLYIPLAFNHTGVDVYYEDEQSLMVFQITVGSDPIGSHPHTREVAEDLFEGDERAKTIVLVVVTESEDVQATTTERGYSEVFMPFGKLDGSLDTIDTVVKKIRSKPEKKCQECRKVVNGQQVECTDCETWYHLACVGDEDVDEDWRCLDCRVAYGDNESDHECEVSESEDDLDFEALTTQNRVSDPLDSSSCKVQRLQNGSKKARKHF